MAEKDSGFSLIELLVTIAVIGVIGAFALPSAINALQAYRLHADTSAVAGFLNVARMRAASQYTPYALDLDDTVTPPTFKIERLQATVYNPLSPTASTYSSLGTPVYELGTQYASARNTFSECLPTAASGVFPGPLTADPSTCSGPFQFCFNTRGMPVQCSTGASPGSPLPNGGVALYITNAGGLTDGVTLSVGGVVQAWGWDPGASAWRLR
jgi:prepilin-type N-terminal cleavage/methylation domain-containing protein